MDLHYGREAVASGKAYSPSESILVVPFWKPDFCKRVIDAAEASPKGFAPLDADIGPGGAAPGQELRLTEFSKPLFENYKWHWKTVLRPIVSRFYRTNALDKTWDVFRDPFILKYTMDTQRSMDEHTDSSLISIAVKLNDGFTGNALTFPRQGWTNEDVPVGWGVIFPGQLTHPHYAAELESGHRYGLTGWIRGTDLRNTAP